MCTACVRIPYLQIHRGHFPCRFVCKRDIESVDVKYVERTEQAPWKNDTHNHSGDPRRREKPEQKK